MVLHADGPRIAGGRGRSLIDGRQGRRGSHGGAAATSGAARHHRRQRQRIRQPRDGFLAYAHGVRLDFIRPGKPVENAFIESFNGKLRDECLNSYVFGTVVEAQFVLNAWREDYNAVRPHSA